MIHRNQLSLSRPDSLDPEFLRVNLMRCVLMFEFGLAFVTSFSPRAILGISHLVKDPEVRAQLSAPCSAWAMWELCLKSWCGRKRRRMEPCCPSQGSLSAFTQELQGSSSSPQLALPPALTMLNNKYLFFTGIKVCKQVQVIHGQYRGTTAHKPCTRTWRNQGKSLSYPVVLMWSLKCPQTSLKDTDPALGNMKLEVELQDA